MELLFPKSLAGTFSEVRRQARKLVKAAHALGSLSGAVDECGGYELIQAGEINFYVSRPLQVSSKELKGAFLSPLLEEIEKSTYLHTTLAEREDGYRKARDLILPATAEWWFSLCCFFSPCFLPECSAYSEEKSQIAETVLRRQLSQWACFTAIECDLLDPVTGPVSAYRWSSFAWGLVRILQPSAALPSTEEWKDMTSAENGERISKITGLRVNLR